MGMITSRIRRPIVNEPRPFSRDAIDDPPEDNCDTRDVIVADFFFDWRRVYSEEHKRYFYYNVKTQISTWEKPKAPVVEYLN